MKKIWGTNGSIIVVGDGVAQWLSYGLEDRGSITGRVTEGKGKKLSLCFNWAPRREGVLGEWRYSSTRSLTSALDGGEWSASRPGRFTLRERAPVIHWIGGWVGPRAVVRRKIPSPYRDSNHRSSSPKPSDTPLSYPGSWVMEGIFFYLRHRVHTGSGVHLLFHPMGTAVLPRG
jgi:hypothetical protein